MKIIADEQLKNHNNLLQDQLAVLTANNESLTAENDALKSAYAEVEAKLNWIEEQLRLEKIQRYGKSSEQADQAQLFDDLPVPEQPETETETITYTRQKSKQLFNKLDTSALERETVVHDIEDKHCQQCEQELVKIDEDKREIIEYIPAQTKVIEHIRPEYTCRACESIHQAPALDKVIPKSPASASLITEVALNKYDLHLPFYRQAQYFGDLGLRVPDKLLGSWLYQAFDDIQPVVDTLWAELTKINYLQVDETPVKVLSNDKKGYIWVYLSPLAGNKFVLYDYQDSRAQTSVDERLTHYKGRLQTDGYAGYNGQRSREDIISLGCIAHCRRKFMDVVKITKKVGIAHQAVAKLAKIYAIEKQLRADNADAQTQYKVRQAEAKPLLEDFFSYLEARADKVLPQSKLATAINYALKFKDALMRYIDHGDVEIDNNRVENKIRPFALGRRNWLFVGNPGSAQASCGYYSLIETCKMNNIHPRRYVNYLFEHASDIRRGNIELRRLLPQYVAELLAKSSSVV